MAFNMLWSDEAAALTVCANEPVPEGYVVTRVYPSQTCYNNGGPVDYDTYDIEIPQGTGPKTVCSVSNVPAGWVVTSVTTSQTCYENGGSVDYDTYTIESQMATPTLFINSETDVIPGSVTPVTLDCVPNTPVHNGVLAGAVLNSTVCTQ